MKKVFLNVPIMLIAILALMFSSCKKDNNGTTEDDSISAGDVASVTNATDQTSDDASIAAGQTSKGFLAGKTQGFGQWWNTYVNGWGICGSGTVDTSGGTITITYDGTTACHGVTRTGTVTITNTGGKPWDSAGAQLTVVYNNLKFTDVLTSGNFTLNGTHIITNQTGGLAWEIVAQIPQSVSTVTHQIKSSNMSVTFPNGETRTWTVDRIRSWSITGSGSTAVITYSVSSDGGNPTETGTNRFGNNFTNMITTPIAANNNSLLCLWKPYQGVFMHTVLSTHTVTVQYGVNSSDQQVDNATTCGDGGGIYITVTSGVSATKTRFIGYW